MARRSHRTRKTARRQPSARAGASPYVPERYEGLVKSIVGRRMAKLGSNPALRDELHQVGRIAAWQSSKTYDPKKGSFTTHAHRWIHGAVGRALKEQGPLHVSERRIRKLGIAGRLEELHAAPLSTLSNHAGAGLEQSDARLSLHSLTKSLKPRERKFLLASATMKQKDIARSQGITHARVNQVLGQAKRKIRSREAR